MPPFGLVFWRVLVGPIKPDNSCHESSCKHERSERNALDQSSIQKSRSCFHPSAKVEFERKNVESLEMNAFLTHLLLVLSRAKIKISLFAKNGQPIKNQKLPPTWMNSLSSHKIKYKKNGGGWHLCEKSDKMLQKTIGKNGQRVWVERPLMTEILITRRALRAHSCNVIRAIAFDGLSYDHCQTWNGFPSEDRVAFQFSCRSRDRLLQ